MNLFKVFPLAILVFTGFGFADLKKVDFIHTKVRGRKIVVPDLTNAQTEHYFGSNFLSGRARALCYVRLENQSEGVFAANENSGEIRLIHTSRQIRTYFPTTGTQPKLSAPTDITVHPDGMGYVVDYNTRMIHQFKVFPDLSASYIAWKQFQTPYSFVRQSVSPSGVRYVFALTKDGALGIFNEDLELIRGVDLHLFSSCGYRALNVGAFDKQKNAFPILALKSYEKGWVDVEYTPDPSSVLINETSMRYASPDVIIDIGLNYHSEDEYNVFALSGSGNILEFTRSGVLVGMPIITEDIRINPNKVLDGANAMSGCSEIKYNPSCQSLVVSEDLRAGGALKKFDVVSNGGSYYHPLKVEIKDRSPSETNISKPAIRITNLSATKVLFGYTLRYWVSKQEFPSQKVLVDKYYTNPENVRISTGCDSGNLNVCYVDITYPESMEVESGQTTLSEQLQFGVHFDQYYPGQWDKANDWSMAGVTAEWSETQKITVYDIDGNLIYGTPPDLNSVPRPPASTASDVLSFEYPSDWNLDAGSFQSIISPCTNGAKCLEFGGSGYRSLVSRPFPLTLPAGSSGWLAVDFQIVDFLPEAQHWQGNIQLYIDSRELSLNNVYVGQVDLSSGLQKQYFKYKWQLPADLLNKLRAGIPDLVIKFVVNTPVGAGPFRIDNIGFQD